MLLLLHAPETHTKYLFSERMVILLSHRTAAAA